MATMVDKRAVICPKHMHSIHGINREQRCLMNKLVRLSASHCQNFGEIRKNARFCNGLSPIKANSYENRIDYLNCKE